MSEPGTRELDRAAFATIAGSFVPCPLKGGAQIAAGRCVEWQQENGCHCEHALPSLRRVEKHLIEEPAREASPADVQLAIKEEQRLDQLDGVRALIGRAEAMERARPATPAVSEASPMHEMHQPPPRPPPVPFIRPTLAQTHREAQAAPPPNPARCEIDGCGKELRVNNLSGLCQEHRQQVPSRKRVGLVSPAARAAGTAGDLVQRAQPKEAFMANTCSKCSKKIRIGRDGVRHDKCLGCRRIAGEAGDGHRLPKAKPAEAPPPKPAKLPRRVNGKRRIRGLDDVVAKHAPNSAPPSDVIFILEERLAHHRDQAQRIEKALTVLR